MATLFVMSEKGVFLQVEFETVWGTECFTEQAQESSHRRTQVQGCER